MQAHLASINRINMVQQNPYSTLSASAEQERYQLRKSQVASRKSQVASRKSQVASRKSQT